MYCKKYKTEVVTDFTHGFTKKINEIYIPQINTCINEEGFAFKSEDARKPIGEYEDSEMSYNYVVAIESYVEHQGKFAEVIKNVFKGDN